MKKTAFLSVLCLSLSVSPALADTVVEEIVAKVNSDVITRSDFAKGREGLRADMKQQYGDQADQKFSEREKDVLRDLIDQQLLLQKGRDLGITADTELIKRLDEIRKQNNLESMEALEEAARNTGINFEDFKQQVRNGIITQQVIGREVGQKIKIGPDEVKQFYEEHRQEFAQPEHIRLSEILVAIPREGEQEPSPEAVAQAETRARELLGRIRGGAPFEQVAQEASQGPTAANGGDLGYFKRGQLAKQLEDLTFALKAGETSDVVRTRQGFIILKVTEHQAEGVPEMKAIENQIMEAIYLKKLQPALREYLTRLREEAFLDIRQGYVDSGASPNQTQPIVVATQQEQEEQQKKKKKRFILF